MKRKADDAALDSDPPGAEPAASPSPAASLPVAPEDSGEAANSAAPSDPEQEDSQGVGMKTEADSQGSSALATPVKPGRGRGRGRGGGRGGSPAMKTQKVELAMAEASGCAMNSQLNQEMSKKLKYIMKHPLFNDIATEAPPQITAEEAENSGMQANRRETELECQFER